MNKRKRLYGNIALVLAAIMLLNTGGVSTVQAKTKTSKIVVLKGEKLKHTYIGLGTIKKVKSSNKKIVSVKKSNGGITMTAKKAGKATITTTGSKNKYVHNVIVKKRDFDISSKRLTDSDALVTFKNNTPVYLDNVSIKATFKNAQGEMLTTKTAYAYEIAPNESVNDAVFLPISDYEDIDFSKTEYEVSHYRSATATYKKYKKVTFTENKTDDNHISVKAKTKYSGKGYINIAYEVNFYDENNNLIDVICYSASLSKYNKSKTTEIYMPDNVVSYKITKRILLKTY